MTNTQCPPRPTITVLCGSTRFVDTFNEQRKTLTEAGHIVLSIEIVTTQARDQDPQHVNPDLKARLDELHLRKIDLADEVFVLNVASEEHPAGYIGESTRSEIEYATKMGKPIRYLVQPAAVTTRSSGPPDPHADLAAVDPAEHAARMRTQTAAGIHGRPPRGSGNQRSEENTQAGHERGGV